MAVACTKTQLHVCGSRLLKKNPMISKRPSARFHTSVIVCMCEVCASHCHHYPSWFHRQRGVWSVWTCYQYMTHCTKAPFRDAHCCKASYHYSHIKHGSLMPENSAMLQLFLCFHNWCKLLCMVFEMQSYTMHTTLYIYTDLSLSNRPPETFFLTHIWILLQSIFYVMPCKLMSQGKLKSYNLVGLQPQQQMTVCCFHHLENQPVVGIGSAIITTWHQVYWSDSTPVVVVLVLE